MCRIANLFLLQRLKGSMSGDACYFNNMETRAVIKFFFFLQGKAPKETRAILIETLGEHVQSHATVKNWVAQFKSGDVSHRSLKGGGQFWKRLSSTKDCKATGRKGRKKKKKKKKKKKSGFQGKLTKGTSRNTMHTGTNPITPMFP